MWPGQKFRREISHRLEGSVGSGKRFHRLDIAVEHTITNRVGERHVPVVSRRVLRQLGLEIMQIVGHRLRDGIRSQPGANRIMAIALPSRLLYSFSALAFMASSKNVEY